MLMLSSYGEPVDVLLMYKTTGACNTLALMMLREEKKTVTLKAELIMDHVLNSLRTKELQILKGSV